tara:strand:- start:316 stop:663 length:348 start_codon:yes stop_codon:yes gene_type:complete
MEISEEEDMLNTVLDTESPLNCSEQVSREACEEVGVDLALPDICRWDETGDEARCVEINPTTEPFGNIFNMSNSSKDRNTMILIIVAILFFMYKDEIMKSGVVKSLKKFLKKMLK